MQIESEQVREERDEIPSALETSAVDQVESEAVHGAVTRFHLRGVMFSRPRLGCDSVHGLDVVDSLEGVFHDGVIEAVAQAPTGSSPASRPGRSGST
jgi:hypothetical protein